MTLAEEFLALSPDRRRIVHERLVEHALDKWKAYARSRGAISYQETVIGTVQTVDTSLPEHALAAVRSGVGIADVDARYGEPIAAMQDKDLYFPDAVEFAYYAIYNFFRKYGLKQEVDDWLIVNQAGSSEENEKKWAGVLKKAIQKAL